MGRPHGNALRWNDLFPLSPLKSGLSPPQVGTDFLNGDKDLRAFLPFVPTVPTKKCRYPDEKELNHADFAPKAMHLLRLRCACAWWVRPLCQASTRCLGKAAKRSQARDR